MTKTSAGGSTVTEGVANKKTAPQSALLERLMAPPAPSTQTQPTAQSLGIMSQLQNLQVFNVHIGILLMFFIIFFSVTYIHNVVFRFKSLDYHNQYLYR